ncbi:hypothetical protein [Desulfonatronum sp. SC1]|uniref:hypothetical protein n=1 Tax=Desulfonatronum sp. SC1 TaxID=2109626 RepID=UPI001304B468|nr:hypothetical protein [Desulfonatronum sp. SC1]
MAFADMSRMFSLASCYNTASLLGPGTQPKRRNTTMGSITRRHRGGRYGPHK